jgi:hypothetical protein
VKAWTGHWPERWPTSESGKVRPHLLVFDTNDVLDRAVLRVAGDVARAHLPTESGTPEQVKRRLVVLHLCRGHEHGQDDPCLAAVDHRVVVVAEATTAAARSEWGGVRIRRAGTIVRGSSIGAAGLGAIGSPRVPDPIVAANGTLGEVIARLVGQLDRQGNRP